MAKQTKKIEKNLTAAEDWKKKWQNGAELISRVTARLQQREAELEVLNAHIKSSSAIVGALAVLSKDIETQSVYVSKSLIKEMIEKYTVSATETEDKLGYIIKVEEVKADEKQTKPETETV
jgi:hypothetical protein